MNCLRECLRERHYRNIHTNYRIYNKLYDLPVLQMELFIYSMRKRGKHINFAPGVNYSVNAWNTGPGEYTLTDEGFFLHRCSIAEPSETIKVANQALQERQVRVTTKVNDINSITVK